MSWLRRFSLKTIILGSFTVVLLATMVPTFLFISSTVDDSLRESLNMRGGDIARTLAEKGATVLQNPVAAGEVLRAVQRVASEGFVGLLNDDLTWINEPTIADAQLGELVRGKLRQAIGERKQRGLLQVNYVTLKPVDLGEGRFLWIRAVNQPQASAIGVNLGDGQPTGFAVVVLSDKQVISAKSSVRNVMVTACVGGLAVFLVLLFFISRLFIIQPLAGMMMVAKKLSDCDLTQALPNAGGQEFGELGAALNRTTDNLRATLLRVKGVSEGMAAVTEQITHSGEVVAKGTVTTAQSVDQTSVYMEQMNASLKGIAQNVEVLAQSATESSASINKVAATNDEVARSVQGLAASVEETTAAIGQMTFSIKEAAKNIEQLSATAGETSSSMNEMDISISQVETNANETAKLSELVSEDANIGVLALQKTLNGIDKIKDSSKQAAEVIASLGRKIGTIGNILDVIDDFAEQTNLLALNAAIIAAQAGEHGQGFAVVADEIKDLAERTGVSTKEISELIRSVQDESKNAIEAVERGVKNVEEGVRLGGEAGSALTKISESASKATVMVKAIARATVEQARGSKQVTNSINRIDQTVQQIAQATAELAKGSEQIVKSAEKMRAITKQVEHSSQEQAGGSKQVTRAMESIDEMVNHLNRAQKEQTRGSEHVMKAVESIKGVVDQQSRSVKALEQAIDLLGQQATVLREEVQRFQV